MIPTRAASIGGGLRRIVLVSLIVGICVAASRWLAPAAVMAAPAVLATPVSVAAFDDCVICWDGCEAGYHYAFDDETGLFPEEWYRNGGAHIGEPYCRTGGCDTKHGPQFQCDDEYLPLLTDSDIEGLRSAILAQDLRAVARYVATFPKRILVNVEREAIQVASCAGAVVMHLPVPRTMVATLQLVVGPAAE